MSIASPRASARGLFHWSRIDLMVRGKRKTAYAVFSERNRDIHLGAVLRTKTHRGRSWRALPVGKDGSLLRTSAGYSSTRAGASILLIQHLNRSKSGRDRLDRAQIKEHRVPR